MGKEVISNQQGIALIALFIMGSSLVLVTGVEAGRDLWIAIILATLLAFPLYAVYARLLSLFPGKDLYQIVEVCFGRVGGKIIGLIYVWFAFHLGSLVLRNFGEYLGTVGLTETPKIIPMIFLALLCLWGAKEGIEVLGRWSAFFINVLAFLILMTVFLMLNKYDLDNITPLLYNGYKPLFMGSWSVIAFPLAEVVVILAFLTQAPGRNSMYKSFWGGLMVGSFFLFLTSLIEILVLGSDLYSTSYFPFHMTISMLQIGNFLERMEIIPAVAFFTAGFIKISACILAASNGVARVFDCQDYRFLVTPLTLLMVNLSYWIYDDIVEMTQVVGANWKYYALVFQIVLPVLILIVAEIRMRREGREKGLLHN